MAFGDILCNSNAYEKRRLFQPPLLSKKEKLFFCLKFFHCGIWTVNSGFVLGGLIPGTYCHTSDFLLYCLNGFCLLKEHLELVEEKGRRRRRRNFIESQIEISVEMSLDI